MTAKLSKNDREILINKALQGENVTTICKEAGISRVVFYRWLKRYEEEGKNGLLAKSSGRPRKQKNKEKQQVINRLSPNMRLKMIDEVVLQFQNISDVSKKYGVSRNTLYKWLKRYNKEENKEKDGIFLDKKPQIERYWRQTPEKYEEAVLSLVSKHPEYGVRKIVSNLPKIGNLPILGHHGVQNVLRRNNLSLYEQRLGYSQKQFTPVVSSITNILEIVSKFFGLAPDLRKRIIHFVTVLSISTFATVVFFGLINFLDNSFSNAEIGSPIGIIFASFSLLVGSFFFLYSLKYYLTLGVVLSFSQGDVDENGNNQAKGNLLSWILGNSKRNKEGNTNMASITGLRSINLRIQ